MALETALAPLPPRVKFRVRVSFRPTSPGAHAVTWVGR